MFIREVGGRIIKNSRREKTIEIILKTYGGKFLASAPSGKSRGKHEVEPYNSKGIFESLRLLKLLGGIIKGRNFMIKKIDDLDILSDIINKFEKIHGKLGGNVIYPLQTVFCALGRARERCNSGKLLATANSSCRCPSGIALAAEFIRKR